jgi:hypothetical protein
LPGGPGGFTPDSTSLVLLWRAHINGDLSMSHTGLSPSMVRLSRLFRYRRFCNPSVLPQPRDESRFGLCPLSLAATYGIDVSFFSSRYLDVSVPWVRFDTPIHSACDDPFLEDRVSAFRNLRIVARLPAPRSLSQAATSFIASRCQGIHHTPLIA